MYRGWVGPGEVKLPQYRLKGTYRLALGLRYDVYFN